MILHDVHLHSYFSTDSEEKQKAIIEAAIEKGLTGICFTDHMDLFFPEECAKKSGGDFSFDLDVYFEELDELKYQYRDKLEILIGMEIGLRNETELKGKCVKGYREMLAKYPFDFIIGSTHCLENIDPYWEEYWNGRTAEEGLDRYFDAICQNVSDCDLFDTLGHLDYLVRYVSEAATRRSLVEKGRIGDFTEEEIGSKRFYGRVLYDPADFSDRIDVILKKVIDAGKSLEINTAGLKYGLGYAHPRIETLKRYRELGGEMITIGSDAHIAGHLAYDFDKACEMLKDIGFEYYNVYRDRKPVSYKL